MIGTAFRSRQSPPSVLEREIDAIERVRDDCDHALDFAISDGRVRPSPGSRFEAVKAH